MVQAPKPTIILFVVSIPGTISGSLTPSNFNDSKRLGYFIYLICMELSISSSFKISLISSLLSFPLIILNSILFIFLQFFD